MNVRKQVAKLFKENRAGHAPQNNRNVSEEYISVGILDMAIDSRKHLAKEKSQKQKCEHLSPVMECFASGFGRIICFDPDFHETCEFKLKHTKLVEEREQIRNALEKFS